MAGQYFGPSQLQLRVPSCRQAGGLSETSVKSVLNKKEKVTALLMVIYGVGGSCVHNICAGWNCSRKGAVHITYRDAVSVGCSNP